MTAAKINLSPKELELVCNTEWILTKHTIIQKVYALFGHVACKMQLIANDAAVSLPAEVLDVPPKISKGENYRQLPYVMLDYPRFFQLTDAFAVRCFFWWGNFFSISLQLSGKYAAHYHERLCSLYPEFAGNDTYLCIKDYPWEHHFEEDNFCLVKNMSAADFSAKLNQHGFIKLSCKTSLSDWEKVAGWMQTRFAMWMKILSDDQAPRR